MIRKIKTNVPWTQAISDRKGKEIKRYVIWKGQNSSFNCLIDKTGIGYMSEYSPKPKSLGGIVKVELDLSNYARKADLKNATEADTL